MSAFGAIICRAACQHGKALLQQLGLPARRYEEGVNMHLAKLVIKNFPKLGHAEVELLDASAKLEAHVKIRYSEKMGRMGQALNCTLQS